MRKTFLAVLALLFISGCGSSLSSPRASISDAVTVAEPRGRWSFTLEGERGARAEFPLTLDNAGLLHASVRWEGEEPAPSRLALILYREGTPGAYARTDGAPPALRLYWTMPPNLLAETQADEWKLAVVNLGDTEAQGELSVQVEPLPAP